ncbi:hypothetical protein Bhyg_03173, partial [Pseudolycoriella hygida]
TMAEVTDGNEEGAQGGDFDLNNAKINDVFIKLSRASPKSSMAWQYFGFVDVGKPTMKIASSVEKRIYCKVCFQESPKSKLFNKFMRDRMAMAEVTDGNEEGAQGGDFDLNNAKINDVFIKLSRASPKSSIAWQYFGFVSKPTIKIASSVEKRIYCKVCFQESPKSKLFNKTLRQAQARQICSIISTGNKILIASKSLVESTASVVSYFNSERKIAPSSHRERKFVLIRDLVILCCRDLLPFNLIEGAGLCDFLEKYKFVLRDDLPNRTSISRALTSVYDDCKAWLVAHLKTQKLHNLHFVTQSFDLVKFTLTTCHFPNRHKGNNILPKVESILDSFGVSEKDIHMVTDSGSNMTTKSALGTYKHYRCIGHALHNLVIKDGFQSSDGITDLLKKVRAVVKALRYRTSEFEKISTDEEELLIAISEISEEFLLLEDDSDDDFDKDENDRFQIVEMDNSSYKTLKCDVKTRWHSTVPMLESVLGNNRTLMKVLLESEPTDSFEIT